MKKVIGFLALAALPLVFGACSQSTINTDLQNFIHNASAYNCHDAASIQAFVNNFPAIPLNPLNGAQMVALQTQYCAGMFGPVAAPVTAPGNNPAMVTITVPVASPAATPSPAK